jgi:hypothetical protein
VLQYCQHEAALGQVSEGGGPAGIQLLLLLPAALLVHVPALCCACLHAVCAVAVTWKGEMFTPTALHVRRSAMCTAVPP